MQTPKKYFANSIFMAIACGVVLLSVITCSSSMARTRNPDSENLTADQFMSLLGTQLHLTEDQKILIWPEIEIDFKQRDKIMTELGKSRANKERLKKELQGLKKETEAGVSPFLSDEQLEKFRTLYEQKLPKTPQKSETSGRTKRSRS